ncbi:MAG: UDP-3-O-(3-hydroxymyristoyl)glucosamine N-acyltransferase [Elusimicrobiota bacterium]
MISVKEIARLVNGKIVGNENAQVEHASSIKETSSGSISFVACSKYYPYVKDSNASVIITPIDEAIPQSKATIVMVDNPTAAFAAVLSILDKDMEVVRKGIDKSAFVDPTAKIGNNVYIGKNVIIENDVVVGDSTVIMANTVIGSKSTIGNNTKIYYNVSIRERVTIGSNVIIHSGVVIGSDGFGFVFYEGVHKKIPQIGTVEIADNVEIGANTAIDRATVGSTKIGKGTKIDNLVQIAHNVEIGESCLVCGQVGIAGSTVIGNYVTLAGQAGVTGHIQIGDKATIAAQAGVTKNIAAKEVVSGYPASPHQQARQVYAILRKLPELYKKVLSLEKKLK